MTPQKNLKPWLMAFFAVLLCTINFVAGGLVGMKEKSFFGLISNLDINPLFLKFIPVFCFYIFYLLFIRLLDRKTTTYEGATDENTVNRS